MVKALKSSFLYSLFLEFIKGIMGILSLLHSQSLKHRSEALGWLENSFVFKMTLVGVHAIRRSQDFLRQSGESSWIFTKHSNLSKLLGKLDHYIVLIPLNYLFIDYGMRTVSALYRFSSIWDELALVGMFSYLAIRPLWVKENYHFRWAGIDYCVALFMLVGVGLLMMVSPDMSVAIEGFRAVFQHMLWFYIFRQLITPTNRSTLYRNITLMGLFLGYHSLYQMAVGVQMPGNWVDSTETITTRVFSIIGSPNILAAVFVLTIPIVAMSVLNEQNKVYKLLALAAVPAMVLGLLFTFSRQAYLALAGALVVYFIMFYLKIVKYLIVLAGAMLLALPKVSERLFYLFTPEYFAKSARGGRIIRYQYAIEQWLKEPWFGRGLGRFGGAVATNNKLTPFYVDSYYLKTLGEMGAVGLVALFVVLATTLTAVKRIISQQRDLMDMLAVSGLFMGLLGIVFQNAVENVFEVPMMVVVFWGIVALALSYRVED